MKTEKVNEFSTLFFSCLFQLHLDKRYGHLVNDELLLGFLHESFLEIMSDKKVQELMLELKKHDETSFLHSFDVMLLTGIMTYQEKKYDVSFMRGGFLHDIGKLLVPASILQKNGKPTVEEFETIKSHTILGEHILLGLEYEKEAIIARSHHERMNGRGYPDGLVGFDIPLEARILGVIDVYSALTLERPYKRAFSNEEAFDMMIHEINAYDLSILEDFISKTVANKDIMT
jgi:HD-GYP domain-containing protein (c-di-GMP phosphodiesterase class II)